MSAQGKIQRRTRRKNTIRRKVHGTPQRPRLTVFRSLKHIYVQAIDDVNGRTLAQASSLNDEAVARVLGDATASGNTVAVAAAVGRTIAERLREHNVETAVFDRNGYLFHGRVKALADGVREGGIKV